MTADWTGYRSTANSSTIANKSPLTRNTVISGRIGSFKVRSQKKSTGGGGALPDGDPPSSVGEHGTNSGELGVEMGTAPDFHQDED